MKFDTRCNKMQLEKLTAQASASSLSTFFMKADFRFLNNVPKCFANRTTSL